MVLDQWRDDDARQMQDAAGADPADRELALRVYTSRLIGQNPDLVMHGGGNTSVKLTRKDLFGNDTRVLQVKGSGWDLASIEAAGLPAVRLEPLLALRALERLSDEDMVNAQRCNLLDQSAPNPSVETLLHAFLPHIYVDHTHATAMLALANLPDVEAVTAEIFGDRLALVPFVMPGFDLAQLAAKIYEQNPDVEGLLLVNHGHFAFGDSARQSYERIIRHTNQVEAWFTAKSSPAVQPASPLGADPAEILPVLRGIIGQASADFRANQDAAMPIMDLRAGPDVAAFFGRPDLAELARRGVATPDHVIRTKSYPLHLTADIVAGGQTAIAQAVAGFIADYEAYFARYAAQADGPRTMLAPTPNLAWIEGLGIVGIGANARAASIAADLAEQTLRVMTDGEAGGGFNPLGEADLFDMEYWSLEQAKLGKARPPELSGRVVLITGGAGAIGLATAKAFAALGASIFLIDRDESALERALADLGGGHGGLALDITEAGAADKATGACAGRFGGLDILVSNAGAAWTGEMSGLAEEDLRASFELNFFAHQAFAKATTGVFEAQGRGGQMLFNVSKQAVNPGKGFGAYGLPKATTLFLLRQLALELGPKGIRVNGINADRIRSGLLDDAFIAGRAKARGIDPATYMAGNLLRREVKAHHVADAFTALARAERTTAHVMTVDGGNIEAALR